MGQLKNLDLAQWLSIAANLGVIAGIVFLALELRQNNEFLESQARLGQLEANTARIALTLNNPEIARIAWMARFEPAGLTPMENTTYFEYVLYTMMHWRWEYDAFVAGELDSVNLPGWRAQAGFSPAWQQVWKQIFAIEDDDFSRFVEANVPQLQRP